MWLDQQVSLYRNKLDNIGTKATLRDILFCEFARDLDTIIDLRRLDRRAPDFKNKKDELKSIIQGYTPAAVLSQRSQEAVIHRTGIISIDFDDLDQYDISEVKQAIGALPFVGYCGLSASGAGLFALVLIAEPEKQREYVEHLFDVFKYYSIPPDTTKGRNVNDLRYVSYDSNPIINDNPEPLRLAIKAKKRQEVKQPVRIYQSDEMKKMKAVNNAVSNISGAQIGQRWGIVQHWSYSLGGFGDAGLLEVVKDAIRANAAFNGQEEKYFKCAADCFSAGKLKPWA